MWKPDIVWIRQRNWTVKIIHCSDLWWVQPIGWWWVLGQMLGTMFWSWVPSRGQHVWEIWEEPRKCCTGCLSVRQICYTLVLVLAKTGAWCCLLMPLTQTSLMVSAAHLVMLSFLWVLVDHVRLHGDLERFREWCDRVWLLRRWRWSKASKICCSWERSCLILVCSHKMHAYVMLTVTACVMLCTRPKWQETRGSK